MNNFIYDEKAMSGVSFYPEPSGWYCELFGTGPNGIVFTPAKGGVPNWFWRWMQYLILGNRWVKDK